MSKAQNEQDNRERTYSTLLDVLKDRPRGVDVYDCKFDTESVRWNLPLKDMDSQAALVWMMAERIKVKELVKDSCYADITQFVKDNMGFIRRMNLEGWTPKMTESSRDEENLSIGVDMIQQFAVGNAVQTDALRMVAYLDPYITGSVRIGE